MCSHRHIRGVTWCFDIKLSVFFLEFYSAINRSSVVTHQSSVDILNFAFSQINILSTTHIACRNQVQIFFAIIIHLEAVFFSLDIIQSFYYNFLLTKEIISCLKVVMQRRHQVRNIVVILLISFLLNLDFEKMFIGHNFIGSFAFADVHCPLETDITGYRAAYKNQDKCEVKNQNRPLFSSPKSISSNVSNEIKNQQKHNRLKPFRFIY